MILLSDKYLNWRCICLCVIFVMLSGCINTEPLPKHDYYLLDEPQLNEFSFSASEVNLKSTKVKVNLVTVADYLAQPNLVMKVDNHQITIANYHIWGEDLPSAIQRILLKDLNSKYKNTVFLERCLQCIELNLYIDHFYPTQSGETVLSGSYELAYDINNIDRQEFIFTVEQTQPGYLHSVKNMRLLLSTLADYIKINE